MKYEVTFEKITKHFLTVEANSFAGAESYVFGLMKENGAEEVAVCLHDETVSRITRICEDTD